MQRCGGGEEQEEGREPVRGEAGEEAALGVGAWGGGVKGGVVGVHVTEEGMGDSDVEEE